MDIQARVKELEGKIRDATVQYEAGTPTVSDAIFDAWRDELQDLCSISEVLESVGAPPRSEWSKVKHKHPMGSLDKVNTPEEMVEWSTALGADMELFVTEKLDGISLGVKFKTGKLVQAWTRGDGRVGEDITTNVVRVKGLPTGKFTGIVRGELVLKKSDFQQHFQGYANPRNATAGTAKRLDGMLCQHLTFLAYEISEGRKSSTEEEQFQELESYGFLVPPYKVGDPNTLWSEYQAGRREALDYEIDGLVVRINDLSKQEALGQKNLRPRGAVAFKFAPAAKETTIDAIVWQTGGSGRVTPVAQFQTVNLVGANVSNASLYNLGYIQSLGLGVGAKVLVSRAGDVIPRVVALVAAPPCVEVMPETCGSCGSHLGQEGEYVVCKATGTCPAQAKGRILAWVQGLGILEWGDTLVEKLVTSGKVSSVPDLYRLTPEEIASLDRMGDRSANKAWENLHARKELPLDLILGSLSIPGIGSSTIRAIMSCGYNTMAKVQEMTLQEVVAVDGVGPVKAQTLVSWLTTHRDLLDDLTHYVREVKPVVGKFSGQSFCFTGEMTHKRSELESLVEERGGEVKSSVTKTLTYLVAADPTTSKSVKAAKYGTSVITEEAFLVLAGVGVSNV